MTDKSNLFLLPLKYLNINESSYRVIPIIPKPKPEPVEINIDLERIEPPVEYYRASAAFETCMV